MERSALEPHAVADGEHPRLERLDARADLEAEGAREHAERLVLDLVVLERESLARLHVEDLPDVAGTPSPERLVTPGLVDPLDAKELLVGLVEGHRRHPRFAGIVAGSGLTREIPAR